MRVTLAMVLIAGQVALAADALPAPFEEAEAVLVPAELPDRLSEASKSGAKPACAKIVEAVAALCLRVPHGDSRRLLADRDLAAAGLTLAAVRARAETKAVREARSRGEIKPVRDAPAHRYWLSAGEPWSAVAYLQPDALLARLPGEGPLLLGIPSVDVALAWRSDGGELDRLMMIAIAKLHGAHDAPITALALRWDGSAWLVHGSAVPRKDASER